MKGPFFILFLSFSCAYAQMCPCAFGKKEGVKTLRFEVGINMFNVREVMINFYNVKPVYMKNISNGLMFKYHFDNFSLRAGFDYAEHAYSYETGLNTNNHNLNTGKNFGNHFRAGIEKTFFTQKLQVFALADALFSSEQYSGISEGNGDIVSYYKDAYRFKTSAFGLSPGVGLKYRPLKHFSISMETSLQIMHFNSKSQQGGYGHESSTVLLFNPLRLLSLNYHF